MHLEDPSVVTAQNEAEIHSWREYLELSVKLNLELGRTRLTARAILALEQNSVIQLSRSTGEGVDLVACGHRIARGEILMIEDRTGVRINEILMQEQ
jgi:flagellar motor switch protein FliN/FliY